MLSLVLNYQRTFCSYERVKPNVEFRGETGVDQLTRLYRSHALLVSGQLLLVEVAGLHGILKLVATFNH